MRALSLMVRCEIATRQHAEGQRESTEHGEVSSKHRPAKRQGACQDTSGLKPAAARRRGI